MDGFSSAAGEDQLLGQAETERVFSFLLPFSACALTMLKHSISGPIRVDDSAYCHVPIMIIRCIQFGKHSF